jgi:DNA polymerase III subunit gamma/tau
MNSNNNQVVWYNKYRPTKFSDVIGQEIAVKILQNAVIKKNVKNAYLLSGSRGVGKTTIARIFANELNIINEKPENSIDIHEMDAASNTSVDDIRNLLENASTPPLSAPYKIFIIDEVHMLSKSAMSALLKILEEPPFYLVFILATTNPEKILPTVLSRLIKIPLANHSQTNLLKNLTKISSEEKMIIDEESLLLVAKKANGGQRDAINYLQTVNEYGFESYNQTLVASLLGILPSDLLSYFSTCITSKNTTNAQLLDLIAKIEKLQITPKDLLNQTLESLLDEFFINQTIADYKGTLIEEIGKYLEKDLPLSSIVQVISYLRFSIKDKYDIDIEVDVRSMESNKTQQNFSNNLSLDKLEKVEKVGIEEIISDTKEEEKSQEKIEKNTEEEKKEKKTVKFEQNTLLTKIIQNSNKQSNIPVDMRNHVSRLIVKGNGRTVEVDFQEKEPAFIYHSNEQKNLEFLSQIFKNLAGFEGEIIFNTNLIINEDNKKNSNDVIPSFSSNNNSNYFYKIYKEDGVAPKNTSDQIEIKKTKVEKPVPISTVENIIQNNVDQVEGENSGIDDLLFDL